MCIIFVLFHLLFKLPGYSNPRNIAQKTELSRPQPRQRYRDLKCVMVVKMRRLDGQKLTCKIVHFIVTDGGQGQKTYTRTEGVCTCGWVCEYMGKTEKV